VPEVLLSVHVDVIVGRSSSEAPRDRQHASRCLQCSPIITDRVFCGACHNTVICGAFKFVCSWETLFVRQVRVHQQEINSFAEAPQGAWFIELGGFMLYITHIKTMWHAIELCSHLWELCEYWCTLALSRTRSPPPSLHHHHQYHRHHNHNYHNHNHHHHPNGCAALILFSLISCPLPRSFTTR